MTKTTNRPNQPNRPNQLILLDTQPDWRLDEHTRRLGREGIARARAALQAGRRSRSPDKPGDQRHRRQPEPTVQPEAPVPHRRPTPRRPAARRRAA
jgi:hypothetical protein